MQTPQLGVLRVLAFLLQPFATGALLDVADEGVTVACPFFLPGAATWADRELVPLPGQCLVPVEGGPAARAAVEERVRDTERDDVRELFSQACVAPNQFPSSAILDAW
jgi:hypothetical protein